MQTRNRQLLEAAPLLLAAVLVLVVGSVGAEEGGTPGDQASAAAAQLERLREALDDADPRVRRRAIARLVAIGDERAAETLAAAALFDERAALREEAIDGLAEIGGPVSLQLLEQALFDPQREVREAAIDAIADVGEEDAAWALAVALADEASWLREQAVYALGSIGGEIAISLLRQALADPDAEIREAAADVLARLEAPPPSAAAATAGPLERGQTPD